jgi:uncharacterized protein with FMN-binding domain
MKKHLSLLIVAVLMLSLLTMHAGAYKAGTYTGKAWGFGGKLMVSVTFSNSAITAIETLEHQETVRVGTEALDKLPEVIIQRQTVAVDTVSCATISSKAMFVAVADAIIKAGGDAKTVRRDLATNSITLEGLNYGVYKDSATIYRYFGAAPAVKIPAQIEGAPVNRISGFAFGNSSHVTSITIPKSVTDFDKNAFFENTPTIHGYQNSAAHQYAIENGCPFVALDGQAQQPGDANGDETVDIRDLATIIDYLVGSVFGEPMAGADANRDDVVDIHDLLWIINHIVAD